MRKRSLAAIFMTLLLVGCGSGGSSNSPVSPSISKESSVVEEEDEGSTVTDTNCYQCAAQSIPDDDCKAIDHKWGDCTIITVPSNNYLGGSDSNISEPYTENFYIGPLP